LNPARPIPIVAGPTAVGKTATSIALAKSLDAEIISADSRQIYREFSIGTACPTAAQLSVVRHHFVHEIAIGTAYSAGVFANDVGAVAKDISERGKNIVVSGGSTLYIHALLHGLSDIPKVEPHVRAELNRRLEVEGSVRMYDELLLVDPVFAQTLDPTKSQRIIRGLEVFIGTGKPISSFHGSPPLQDHLFQLFVLHRERKQLYQRIDDRVDQMISEGLVDELKGILATSPNLADNAFRTIGYQELIPHLLGKTSLDEAVSLIKRNSRRYAKRQLTWFKRYPGAIWIDVDTEEAVNVVLSTLDGELTDSRKSPPAGLPFRI
jgi:tRNA dimethylallyltransferase